MGLELGNVRFGSKADIRRIGPFGLVLGVKGTFPT